MDEPKKVRNIIKYAVAPLDDGSVILEVDDDKVTIPAEHLATVLMMLDRMNDLRWNERHEITRVKGKAY